jgi:hypothetical protein
MWWISRDELEKFAAVNLKLLTKASLCSYYAGYSTSETGKYLKSGSSNVAE